MSKCTEKEVVVVSNNGQVIVVADNKQVYEHKVTDENRKLKRGAVLKVDDGKVVWGATVAQPKGVRKNPSPADVANCY